MSLSQRNAANLDALCIPTKSSWELDIENGPGTRYAYLVDDHYRGTFVTQEKDGPFTFAVFGHPGGTTSPHHYPARYLASTLKALAPTFLLCTGDVCYYTAEHSFKRLYFDVFREVLAERPIYLTAANHEAGFPTSQVRSYRTFRSLFPYDFPSKTHAYHSFRRGNVEFFAFAYGAMSAGQDVEQMEWLAKSLQESQAEFRIVYLGGGQSPLRFDRDLFFATARENGADLVFGGDGISSRVEDVDGLKFSFAGTEQSFPPSFFYARVDAYDLEITKYDANMERAKGQWDIETKRPKVPVFDARTLMGKGAVNGSIRCGPIGVKSTDFHGVKLVIENPFDTRTMYWLRWSTASTTGGGDYYFRSKGRWLKPGETETKHFELPATNPVTGKPWLLKEFDVRIGGANLPDDMDLEPWIHELTVFRDPLRK